MADPVRATVFLMVKEPRPGRVKTRLAREIGEVAAARFYRHNTAAVIRRLCADGRWRLVLAVAPMAAWRARWWPGDVPRVAQGEGGLGERMAHVFARAAPGPVMIVGSDIPGVTSRRIGDALRALHGNDAVIGPAPDGGYWLIGLRRGPAPRGLFECVRWSGPHARTDTIHALEDRGLQVGQADVLADVDDAKSYSDAGATSIRLIRADRMRQSV
jgi:rSAM/selenodomain-associated transferase 1